MEKLDWISENDWKKIILEIENEYNSIVENRRYIHMNPEIGFDTKNTEAFIQKKLQECEIQVLSSEMGVLGLIKGNSSSKIVALRADMDALCLQEETGAPYASKIPNKMHACGHDGHTAMLIGAAKILQQNRHLLPMDVLLIFQPAEEGPNLGGARVMLADLEKDKIACKICKIFALHLFNDFETGKVGIKYGSLMSSTDEFDIKIVGKGGHAGQPNNTVDALSIGAKVISSIESYMSRRMDPFEPAVCSVGIFNAGTAKNIVSETAVIAGTIRCQSEKAREEVIKGIKGVTKGVCAAFGAECNIDILRGLPVLINDDLATSFAEKIAKTVAGDKVFVIPQAAMGAEDFAYFAEKIPSSFMWIGSGNEEKGFTSLAHHAKFDFDENAMKIGVQILCGLAMGTKD